MNVETNGGMHIDLPLKLKLEYHTFAKVAEKSSMLMKNKIGSTVVINATRI